MAGHPSSRVRIVGHIAAALLGGYVLTWGFIALGVTGMFALGMEFHDAESLASMLGLLLFLIAFLWTFAVRRLGRLWLLFAGGGALMTILAWLIQALLLQAN